MVTLARRLLVVVALFGWALPVPFLMKSSSAAQSFTISVTKVDHNVTVDEKLFVKPGL